MIIGEHNRKNPWEGRAKVPLAECSIEKSSVGFYSQIILFIFVKKVVTISLQCPCMATSQILNLPIPKHKVTGSWNKLDLLVPLHCLQTRGWNCSVQMSWAMASAEETPLDSS